MLTEVEKSEEWERCEIRLEKNTQRLGKQTEWLHKSG